MSSVSRKHNGRGPLFYEAENKFSGHILDKITSPQSWGGNFENFSFPRTLEDLLFSTNTFHRLYENAIETIRGDESNNQCELLSFPPSEHCYRSVGTEKDTILFPTLTSLIILANPQYSNPNTYHAPKPSFH